MFRMIRSLLRGHGGRRPRSTTPPRRMGPFSPELLEARVLLSADGLVAAYGFNEGAGTVVHDSSGYGNDGTVRGAVWVDHGKYGGALFFDGVHSQVRVPDSPSLELTTGMTLEAWVRPFVAADGTEAVLGKGTYALDAAGADGAPAANVRLEGEGRTGAQGAYPLPAYRWSYLAATFDGASLRLYVNGRLVQAVDAPGTLAANGSVLRIGADGRGGHFFGLIDEVRIYDRALRPREIRADMRTPVPDEPGPPSADAGPAQEADEGQDVTFAGSATGGTAPLSYAWDFGDGTTASDTLAPSHSYTAEGTYTVTLTVTDARGLTSQASTTATVGDAGPTADAGGPYTGAAGSDIAFAGAATDPNPADLSGLSYSWDFGDGATSDQQSPTHAYATAGPYTATLTVTEADGDSATATATVTVTGDPPLTADAGPSQVGPEGQALTFAGTASGGTAPYSYSWDFGDRGTASGTLTPSHSYSVEGQYTATLTVTDAAGAQATGRAAVTVTDAGPSAAVSGPLTAPPGSPLTVSADVTDPNPADLSGVSDAWSVTKDGAAFASGSGTSFTFTPDVAATYVVALTATEADGDQATATRAITVGTPSSLVLLPDAQLSALRREAAVGTPQWQAFKAELDANLPVVLNEGDYQGSELQYIADYALGYQVLKDSDPPAAADYADKAIALMKSGLHDYQKGGWEARQFLARGDGVTTTFTLPNADVIPSSLHVYLANTQVVTVRRGAGGADDVDFYSKFLKVSDSPDGNPDYAEGSDWSHNPDLPNNQIDWSTSGRQPAAGATYYVTEASGYGPTDTAYTLSGNQVTLAAAPGTNQAVWVEYVYGTHSDDGSTLAYQQTSGGDGGLNSIFIDDSYTARYLGQYISLGLSWLDGYVGFAPALKAEAVTMLDRWARWEAANGYLADNPESNYGAGGYASRVFTALALQGRSPDGPALLQDVLDYRTQHVVPLLTSPTDSLYGGFWSEGWNYGQLAAENLLQAGLALEQAGAIPAAAAERQWAGQAVEQVLSASPAPDTIWDGGDWFAYPSPFPGKDLFYVLGALASSPADQQYANYVIQNYSGAQTADHMDLLFRNPSAPASPWSGLPLQDFAAGTGTLTARSDWGGQPTWVVTQFSNLLGADHQTYSPGLLQIQRGDDDLLINGNAPGGNQPGADGKSTYSNTVVVDDGGAGYQTYPYSTGYWYGSPGVVVNAYEATAAYAYISGNYAAAYSPNSDPGGGGPVSELNREVVYLRPGYVVVYDRVTTLQPQFVKELRWHFLNAPTVTGNSFVEAVGSSKLFGQTFSQAELTTSVAPVTVGEATVQEVITQNAAPAASERYVTAFQVADAGTAAMDATAHVLSADGRMEGVQVGNQLVLFGHDGAVTGTAPVSYALANAVATQNLLVNLEAGHGYQVTVDGATLTTVTASSQGTISFNTPARAQNVTVTQVS